MNLPKDSFMLLSLINTKLRDEFNSIEDLCKSSDIDLSELKLKLGNIGYIYNTDENQFKA